MGEIIVREARADEYVSVDELAVDVYVAEGYVPVESADGLRGAARRAEGAQVLVACDETGRLTGTVTLVLDGGPQVRMSQPGEAEIRLLAVSTEARGRGVGSKLVRECLARANAAGRARCVLCTQPSMAPAHRVYEREGFVREAARDFVTDAGVSMLVYGIEL
jgi:ribosomal protein S18 acetylase RimI-like enzyme